MYLSTYNLLKKPFDISPNPEFLWLGEKHKEGLATLEYGILQNKGYLMITGDIGTGKTALIRAIAQGLDRITANDTRGWFAHAGFTVPCQAV